VHTNSTHKIATPQAARIAVVRPCVNSVRS